MPSVKELEFNNTVYDVKGKTVVDNNSGELSFWSGSKAQYDAIQNKDSKCLYSINDDTDVSLTILEALYPVGSVYITTANTCPLSALIRGSTWELVSSGIVKSGDIPCKGNGMTLGLLTSQNGVGVTAGLSQGGGVGQMVASQSKYGLNAGSIGGTAGTVGLDRTIGITTDPTKSGIIADTSSLTLSVNIFERTA